MPSNDLPSPAETVLNIAAYKFVPLTELAARRQPLRTFCRNAGLRGTILLSPEGINLFVAGEPAAVERLLDYLAADAEIGELTVKRSWSQSQPFNRMLVRLKQEIIAFGVEGIDPRGAPTRKISPQQLQDWLEAGEPLTLLDVRNDYEIRLGTFQDARTLPMDHFKQFPALASELQADKEQPVVMFCTGGIRCEKAGPYLECAGFREVYQLDGGILKYFEECGARYFDGECFVFDKRTALDANLQETATTLCYACQNPLQPDEQANPKYVPGASCPYCYQDQESL